MSSLHFGHAEPILVVEDLDRAVAYYTDILGFRNADWAMADFTCVSRGGVMIYLTTAPQGRPGAWAYVGISDVAAYLEEIEPKGARIRSGLRNYPWAAEIVVEDPDGNVLRFGSDPLVDRPFDTAPVGA